MTQIFDVEASEEFDLSTLDIAFIEAPDEPQQQYNPGRYEQTLRVVDTEDKEGVVALIKDELDGMDWTRVDYRYSAQEYNDEEYAEDGDYYHKSHELRTPPTIEFVEDYTVEVTADWVIEGAEHSDELEITLPSDFEGYTVEYEVVGTNDGIAVDGSGVALGTVTLKEPIDRVPQSGIRVVDYPDGEPETGIVYEHGDRPEPQSTIQRLRSLETATKETGPESRGVAQRIDELEDRIKELEGS